MNKVYLNGEKKKVAIGFYKFLKEHGALEKWKHNTYEQQPPQIHNMPFPYCVNPLYSSFLLLGDINYSCLIDESFLWSKTIEGADYWERLDVAWRRHWKEIRYELTKQ